MLLDKDVCSRALDARDPRVDGVFFVGVKSSRCERNAHHRREMRSKPPAPTIVT